MVGVSVSVDSSDIASIRDLLSGPEVADLNAVGGRAASQAAVAYHRQFDSDGGWRGRRSLNNLTGGSEFGADVARGWKFDEADANGASISNDASYYAFKVSGGTITPKRAKALTIPLIPEARGLRVSTYVQNTGRKLFTITGKNALFETMETGGVRPVYALVKSLTQKPWPGALPPEDLLIAAFEKAWLESLDAQIDE